MRHRLKPLANGLVRGLGLLLLTALAVLPGIVAAPRSNAQGASTPAEIRPTFGAVSIGSPAPGATASLSVVDAATPTMAPSTTPESSPTPSGTPTPVLPTLRSALMGIQVYAYVEESSWFQLVDRVQFLGVSWIKAQVSWSEMEPEPGVFSPVFTVVRDNLIYAGRRGFRILISVVGAPDWARPPEARGSLEGPPADPNALAAFVGTLLDQWGTEYINALEVWNEPNLIREWTGMPRTGADYHRYFMPTYAAIRARSADIVVVTAGPAPAGDTPDGSVNDRTWLRDLYAAGLPISDPNLAIGIHPYAWANAPDARCCASPGAGWDDQRFFFFLDNIEDYRQIMLENGHGSGQLWATEFGWATFQGLRYRDHVAGPEAIPPVEPSLAWMSRLTEAQQGEYIVRAFELAQSGDLAAFMGPMVLWNMNFAALEGYVNEDTPSLPEAGFSLLNTDWATRPAYELLQAAPRTTE